MTTPVMRVCGMRLGCAVLVAGLLAAGFAAPRPVVADIASDHPAAILVFPKLIVNTTEGLDTVVRISNVSNTPLNVYCFYVNATPQCSLDQGTSCFPNKGACLGDVEGKTTDGMCLSKWQETDFIIRLTKDQPTGWLVSGGERTDCPFIEGVCSNDNAIGCGLNRPCPTGAGRCILPPCLPLDGGVLGRTGPGGQVNEGAVPLSPEDPFIGELKCIAIDESLAPVARNDLIGDVLIGRAVSGPEHAIEVEGYNAIGIPALVDTCQPNGTCSQSATPCPSGNCPSINNRDSTLVLGGPPTTAEYEGCPNILVLDHYFDGAVDPVVINFCRPEHACSVSGTPCTNDNECIDNICLGGPGGTCSVTSTPCDAQADCNNSCGPTNVCTLSGEHCLHDDDCTDPIFQTRVVTEVTLIPCTEDFKNQRPELSKTTVQFLVYNEFEQRFSTSTPVECFKEIRLSKIDEANPNSRSIFSAGVGGTLTGQTRIRGGENGTSGTAGPTGHALLGVAEEFRCGGPKYQFPLCNFVDDPERVVSTTAKNLHFQGRRPTSDFIYLP